MTYKDFITGVGFDLITAFRKQLEANGSVITGNLKRSITFQAKKGKLIVKMVGYGKHVEYGTINSRPYPFLRPVIHRELPSIIKNNLRHL